MVGTHRWFVLSKDILDLAATQFGVVGYRQLTNGLQISRSRIWRARRAGLVVDMTSRVVRVASSPVTMNARCMAMQLHADGVGFLSGPTAARLHGFRKMPTEPINFTVPVGRRLESPEWARVHFTRWYDASRDRQTLPNGLTVATPLRTLFGLAAKFNQFRFRRAAEDAWHLGLTSPAEAAAYLEVNRCRGKDGVFVMEEWLEHALGQVRPAQSGLEQTLLDAFERVGLPRPVRQYPLTLGGGDSSTSTSRGPTYVLRSSRARPGGTAASLLNARTKIVTSPLVNWAGTSFASMNRCPATVRRSHTA